MKSPFSFTDLLSSVMSSAVQGMPRVISDSELTTGLTKASPVVIPDKMPMTTLNLDLMREEKSENQNAAINQRQRLLLPEHVTA